jgi:hypothetical protein
MSLLGLAPGAELGARQAQERAEEQVQAKESGGGALTGTGDVAREAKKRSRAAAIDIRRRKQTLEK